MKQCYIYFCALMIIASHVQYTRCNDTPLPETADYDIVRACPARTLETIIKKGCDAQNNAQATKSKVCAIDQNNEVPELQEQQLMTESKTCVVQDVTDTNNSLIDDIHSLVQITNNKAVETQGLIDTNHSKICVVHDTTTQTSNTLFSTQAIASNSNSKACLMAHIHDDIASKACLIEDTEHENLSKACLIETLSDDSFVKLGTIETTSTQINSSVTQQQIDQETDNSKFCALQDSLIQPQSKVDALNELTQKNNSIVDGIDDATNATHSKLCHMEESVVEQTNSKLCIIETTANEVESKLCALDCTNNCAATPITSTTTLSTSGSYCLANDIGSMTSEGFIYIDSSDVTVDLNGYTVYGFISTIESNTSIKNGFITKSTSTAFPLGISIAGGPSLENAKIHDVVISGAYSVAGIQSFVNFNKLIIDNVCVQDAPIGILLDRVTDIQITNSYFTGLSGTGIQLQSVDTFLVDNCTFHNDGLLTANIHLSETGSIAVTNGVISNCNLEESTSISSGILIDAPIKNIKILNANIYAQVNGIGVSNNDVTSLLIQDCTITSRNNLKASAASGINFGFISAVTAVNIIVNRCTINAQDTGIVTIAFGGAHVENMVICNCIVNDTLTGYRFESIGVTPSTIDSVTLSNCKANGSLFQGFIFNESNSGDITNLLVKECYANGCGQGFVSNLSIAEVVFVQNVAMHCTTPYDFTNSHDAVQTTPALAQAFENVSL